MHGEHSLAPCLKLPRHPIGSAGPCCVCVTQGPALGTGPPSPVLGVASWPLLPEHLQFLTFASACTCHFMSKSLSMIPQPTQLVRWLHSALRARPLWRGPSASEKVPRGCSVGLSVFFVCERNTPSGEACSVFPSSQYNTYSSNAFEIYMK